MKLTCKNQFGSLHVLVEALGRQSACTSTYYVLCGRMASTSIVRSSNRGALHFCISELRFASVHDLIRIQLHLAKQMAS